MKFALVFAFFAVYPYFILAENSNRILEPRQTNSNSSTSILNRNRRHLDFLKGTRVFLRANIKQNVFTFGAIWAFAQGYKANNPMLNDQGTRPFRRDTYKRLQSIMDLHGFDGEACLLNVFCTVTRGSEGQSVGLLFKLMRYIFKCGIFREPHPEL